MNRSDLAQQNILAAPAPQPQEAWLLARNLIFIVREQSKIIFFGLGATVTLALLLFALTPKTYEAKAKFIIDQLPFRAAADPTSDSEISRQLASSLITSIPSSDMQQIVAERLGIPITNIAFTQFSLRPVGLSGPDRANISVTQQTNSRVGLISVEAANPDFAAKVANVILDELLLINRIAGRLDRLDFNLKLLRAKADRLSQEGSVTSTEQIKFETQSKQLQEYQNAGGPLENFAVFADDLTLSNLKTQKILVQGEYDGLAGAVVRGPRLDGKRREMVGLQKQIDQYAAKLAEGIKTAAQMAQTRATDLDAQLKALQDKSSSIQEETTRLTRALGSAKLRREYGFASDNNQDQEASVIVVMDRARVPHRPTSTRLLIYLALGLVAGAVIATGAASLRHHLDRRMRFPAQIEFLSQVPCLAVIVEPETIASRPQTTPAGLAFLRSQFLRAQAVGEQERIFAFTGLGSQDGTQELVAELAALLAKAEKRTLVVDLNFRDSTMPQLLGIQPHGKGLADWLWSEDPIQDYIHYSAIRELALLPTGQLKGDVDDLLSRRALAPDLKTLESEWDFILISAPSLLKVWYVLQAAPPEAHLIGVARYAEATLDDVIELQNRCIQSHLTLAGVVLHHFPKKHLKKEQMLWEFGPHRYLFDEV